MIKSYTRTLVCLILLMISFQNAFCQDSLIVRGNVVEFSSNEYMPGVKIEAYNDNNLSNETYCDVDGNFKLSSTFYIDKLVFSFVGYYSTIIENISNNNHELILREVKLYNRNDSFVTYLTKEAERKDEKEEKRKIKELKKGVVVSNEDKNYKMILKKRKGVYSFYIEFIDFETNK